MATIDQSPEFRVERRVRIGLDALDDWEKEVIGPLIGDRERFLAAQADPGRVEKISDEQSLYTLSLPSDLRLVFSKIGETIVIVDLMNKEFLDYFGKNGRGRSAGEQKLDGPGSRAKKSN